MTYFIFQMQITITSELIEGNELTIVVNASAYESLKHKFQLHVPVTSDTNVLKNISGKYGCFLKFRIILSWFFFFC